MLGRVDGARQVASAPPRARAITRGGIVHHTARVSSVTGGIGSGISSIVSFVLTSFLTKLTTWSVTRTVPKNAATSPVVPSRSASTTSMSVTSRACV